MFTIPYSYVGTGQTSSELLTGLVTSTGTPAYDIAAWNPLLGTYALTPTAPADVPVPGQGYWGRFSSTGGGLIAAGTAVTSPSYGVGINVGWNMIGDPFLTNTSVSNLEISNGSGTYSFASAVSNGLISGTLYGYDGSAYVPITSGSTLQTWQGYWIYSGVSAELIFIQ
jgi:hypothetical protein